MNSALINYDLLYSPDPKKDNFKAKGLYQSPASTSLTNSIRDKNLTNLKSPNSNTKTVYSLDNNPKYYYTSVQSLLNAPTNTLPDKMINKPQIPSEKINIINNTVNTNINECFKVFARIRPLNSKEINLINANKKQNFLRSIIKLDDTSVKLFPIEYQINIGKDEKIFVFDQVFDENDNNEDIFRKTVLSPVENLLNGYNSTILAYGMTGTGKTHTMFGDIYCQNEPKDIEPGLIILAVKDIFWKIEIQINENRNLEFKIKLSYLEIYNEQVKDLLVDTSENLMILEDQIKGVVIPDLIEKQLNNPNEIINFIDQGNSRRTMASTSSNQFSSRSHAILILSIEKRNLLEPNQIIYVKFCLVDLAGSERALLSDIKGIRMTEGSNINKSLLALGNCINILSDSNKKGAFVPYRDSKLTRLLKESLGGNTKTIMIACLSPSSASYEETLNTLKYASRAKNIKRKVNKNIREIEDVTEYKGIIEGLKNEIDSLKEQLLEKNRIANENMETSDDFDNNKNTKRNDIKPILNKELEVKIEGISQKILTNLEENWEIKQSVLELKNLKISNEMTLKEKQKKLEILKNDNPIFLNLNPNNKLIYNSSNGFDSRRNLEIESLEKDIKLLEETMLNNDKILAQMEAHMSKTVEIRDRLHDDMLKFHEKNNEKLVIDLKMACEILNKEKMDLHAQNIEMKKKEENMAKLQEEKENTIKEMQKQLEVMKKKLDEKDKIIEENNIIIKNLSSNNLDLIKSTLAKHKNYRSNTSENSKLNTKFQPKFEKMNFKSSSENNRIEDFPKNTSGIRQYFKGKSTVNTNNYGIGVENEGNGLISNRSNFDSKALKKNLDKLSECSSLTRFEAGNNELYIKNSILLTNEENSPHKIKNKNSIENFEDIECTKKIVENLTEVSSILQEESQNFSVSDQIMIENLEKSEKDNKTINKLEKNKPINEEFNINPNMIFQKKINETEENKNIFIINQSSEVQSLLDKNKLLGEPRYFIENNAKISQNQLKQTNSYSQSNFYPQEYRFFIYKDRIQKAFNILTNDDRNKDVSQLLKEIFDLILENNRLNTNLDDFHGKMFKDLKDFYYKHIPKGSDPNHLFLEKNRSNSANADERTETSSKSNVKVISTKIGSLPSNGSFVRTSTEKGFYESVDKLKKNQPFHYVKYGSINLQDNLTNIPLNTSPPAKDSSIPIKKNDSIHTNKSEEKNYIPWDELTRKGKDTPNVQSVIAKQREHLREEYAKLDQSQNLFNSNNNYVNNYNINNPAPKITRFSYYPNYETMQTEKSPENLERQTSNTKALPSPTNYKSQFKSDFNNYLIDNYSKNYITKK